MQIARDHAANTVAAIQEQQSARLANRLENYAQALSESAAGDDGAPATERKES